MRSPVVPFLYVIRGIILPSVLRKDTGWRWLQSCSKTWQRDGLSQDLRHKVDWEVCCQSIRRANVALFSFTFQLYHSCSERQFLDTPVNRCPALERIHLSCFLGSSVSCAGRPPVAIATLRTSRPFPCSYLWTRRFHFPIAGQEQGPRWRIAHYADLTGTIYALLSRSESMRPCYADVLSESPGPRTSNRTYVR